MTRKTLLTRRDWMQEDGVVLSGGVWQANLPLTNLLDHRPQFVTEAVNNSDWGSTTFDVDLGQDRYNVGMFFFANLRTSSLGLMQVIASLNSDFSSPTFDTGSVSTWPVDSTPGELNNWGDWSLNGVYGREEYMKLGMPRIFIPSSPISCRYISVNFYDSTLTTPLQIGCFGACEVWESPKDFGPAPQITIIDESEIIKVPQGSQYINERATRRRMNFGFPALEESEMTTRTLGLLLQKGRSKPLVAVSFPDKEESLEKLSVYGLVSSDNVLSNPFFGHWAQPVQIDQLV